jgi:4-amino-4-deoxy-L-arabinose transferase-like glycosyltransferase
VGREEEARWVRPALLGLLVATAVLYLWGLGASGWANSFYSAAAQAGTKSWKAFFFGASDAAASITVDKPPASLWVMALSARIFGLSSWSILVPEALEGVAAVGFLYAAVRRWFTPAAGLLAGAVLALTPISALMFRFNNPDALLVLLLTAGAYAMVRALEAASTRWLLLAFTLVGFGFLTKMLQALLVVPAFGLVYLIAAPTPLRRRLGQLVGAGVALLVSAGWWVAIVELIPVATRPYIGGSQTNSVLNLIFGYNGLGRVTGNEVGSVGGGGGQGGGQWGPTGWTRMFNAEFGGQASWLLPAALILVVALLVLTWRAVRTDRTRAAALLWGGWLLVTAAVFSLSQGIIHPYYTVALAPAIGALVGIGGAVLWRRRHELFARIALAVAIAASAWWAAVLLGRTPSWVPWLRPLVLVLGLGAAIAVALGSILTARAGRYTAGAAIVAALAGPTAYSLSTARAAHAGALPTAGPATGRGFGPGGGAPGGPGGQGQGGVPGRFPAGGFGGPPPAGGAPAGGQAGVGQAGAGQTGAGQAGQAGAPAGRQTAGGRTGASRGGVGGLLEASTPSSELVQTLLQGSDQYTWVASTIGANQASGYQLATDASVMPIGGFNGSDPSPTLAQFQQLVADGRIHYFISGGFGGGGPGGGSSGTASQITSWVTSSFTSTTVGGVSLYDLTAPVSG